MNPNLPRWIWASLTKYFKTTVGSYPLEIEGYDRLEQKKDSFELRIDGPDYQEVSKDFIYIDIFLNVLITCIKDERDAHKIEKLKGLIASGFTNEISIYKYGSDPIIDDKSLVGCFILQTTNNEKILITNFGLVEGTQNILQATVEGHYRMTLN